MLPFAPSWRGRLSRSAFEADNLAADSTSDFRTRMRFAKKNMSQGRLVVSCQDVYDDFFVKPSRI